MRSIVHPLEVANAGAGSARLRRALHEVRSELASQVEERQRRPAGRGLALGLRIAIVWFRFEVDPAGKEVQK